MHEGWLSGMCMALEQNKGCFSGWTPRFVSLTSRTASLDSMLFLTPGCPSYGGLLRVHSPP